MIVDRKIQISVLAGDAELICALIATRGYSLTPEPQDQTTTWVLEHPGYSNLHSAEEVRDDANRLVERLKKVGALEGEELDLQVGAVLHVNSDGIINKTIFAQFSSTITFTAHAAMVLVKNPLISEEERQRLADEAAAREAEEKRHAKLRRMAHTLARPLILELRELLAVAEPSGLELGHIMDLLKDLTAGKLDGYCSKADIDRFYRSINHQDVMGKKARHIASKQEPPPNPMNIEEATRFARRVGNAWLRDTVA